MTKLILLRHGESEWNKEGKFTGWTNVDLSNKGVKEAVGAGKKLKRAGLSFDLAYSSFLKRAIKTLNIVLEELDLLYLPVKKDWRLNERHYGDLQGLSKEKTIAKFGEEQVKIWRRSYGVRPPLIKATNKYSQSKSLEYKGIRVPRAESLADVLLRVSEYWNLEIKKELKKGKNILITASGNSLRALLKYLANISEDDVLELNIPTAIPLVCEFDKKFKLKKYYYLATKKELDQAINRVKKQGQGALKN